MRTFLMVVVFLLSPYWVATTEAQVPEVLIIKPVVRTLEIRAGAGLEMAPISGAVIVIMNEQSVVLAIQMSNDRGSTFWTHPGDQKFKVAVAAIGYQAKTLDEGMLSKHDVLGIPMFPAPPTK